MKILILVQSVDSDRYPELIKKQQETWDSVIYPDIEVYYYYPKINGELGIDLKNIYVQGTDNWEDMFSNTIKAFKSVLHLDWDYLVKTDNSAYINKEKLVELLKDKPKTKYYGGEEYEFPHPNGQHFLWGECIIFSKDIIVKLVETYLINRRAYVGMDDVSIAHILYTKVEPDKTLHICQYYKEDKPLPVIHAYRCKNDNPDAVRFDDDLTAMDNIHKQLTS